MFKRAYLCVGRSDRLTFFFYLFGRVSRTNNYIGSCFCLPHRRSYMRATHDSRQHNLKRSYLSLGESESLTFFSTTRLGSLLLNDDLKAHSSTSGDHQRAADHRLKTTGLMDKHSIAYASQHPSQVGHQWRRHTNPLDYQHWNPFLNMPTLQLNTPTWVPELLAC